MSPELWQKIKQVFHSAIQLEGAGRDAFLDKACTDNPEVRSQVEILIRTHESDPSFLETLVSCRPTQLGNAFGSTSPSSTAPQSCERTDTQIGVYTLQESIGQGGFGEVWAAEQGAPMRRRVALKIIKAGMDSKEVLARFEAERQALALMDHPHVAKVFDAGETEEGRPYFVMEYVLGLPITEYCDIHRMPIRQRLELFMFVCHAVQHAHQKGIIHRDLKPSNILVTPVDGRPVPKVIDFGIAKATANPLTERTLQTEIGQLIGTPTYMSPEQAGLTSSDVDTRTDIYSLGVLLYELLTGACPLDERRLREAGYAEMQRIIREVEPPKPSAKLSSFGVESSAIAHAREAESGTLIRTLRGDLDWVVMKCLEKDRTRRYATPNDVALDVQRFLANEPVMAGPPTATYRLRKFVRRNKGPVAAAVAVVMVLIAGLAGTSYGLIRAVREGEIALQARKDETAQRKLAEASEQKALAARDEAETVTEFFTDALAAVDPAKHGKDVTVREWLDKTAEQVDEVFAEQPLLEAPIRYTMGRAYYALGLYDRAEEHAAEAAAIYTRNLGERNDRTLSAMQFLAALLRDSGDSGAVESQERSVLAIRRRVQGDEHPDTLGAMNNLAIRLSAQGRYAEAEKLQRETLEIQRRVLGDEHPNTLVSMSNLAQNLFSQGRYAEAEALQKRTLEMQRHVLGEEHPYTLASMNMLGSCNCILGRYTEAEGLYRKTLQVRRRVLGDEHPHTLGSMNNLALSLAGQGRYAEAEALHRKTLEIRRRALGAEHPDTLESMNNLARSLSGQGRYAEAEAMFRETLEIDRRVFDEQHPDTLRSMSALADSLFHQGRYTEAEALQRKTLELKRRVLGEEHPSTALSAQHLAEVLEKMHRWSEAEGLCRQAGSIWAAEVPAAHPARLYNANILGGILAGQGRYAEAEALLVESYESSREAGEQEPFSRRAMVERFIFLYESWHETEPDNGHDTKAAEWRAKLEDRQTTSQAATQLNARGARTPPGD